MVEIRLTEVQPRPEAEHMFAQGSLITEMF